MYRVNILNATSANLFRNFNFVTYMDLPDHGDLVVNYKKGMTYIIAIKITP
jgi:hypothetical protein